MEEKTMSPSSAKFGYFSTAEKVTEGIDASHMTAVVTGATSGVGRETARVLALRGAQVVVAARNVDSGERLKQAILQDVGNNARVHVIQLDLGSMQSVREFVASFESKGLPLNVLINNAGIMACPFSLSADCIELQFATNYLGHFLLTNLLLSKMKSTAEQTGTEGRIVCVTSAFHSQTYKGGVLWQRINEKSSYSQYKAYGQSKLAMILSANELARRLSQENANVTINCVHPGVIATNIFRHSKILALATKLISPFLKSIQQGAATQCFVALHPSVSKITGKYFADCKVSSPHSIANNPELAEKLWEFSLSLTSSEITLKTSTEQQNESSANNV
ncbi:hypothetical protein KP509_33G014300 [Ceratopteris richardii]|uniref:Short-chain dehydrogenase TIC 32, chloroplastic-like n=1 Tax=Ceratopteris richardii TaxID=49495 RepID=A0A8T2QLU1_CERRI|nr:hypothetical protein KP509_33G014300 [Ceratopteris richardii]